jgi:hypothetical protein
MNHTWIWSSAKWKLGLLGEGKMRFSFFLLQPRTPTVHGTYSGKRPEIALLHAAKQTRAGRAPRTNHLSIQGNPKADFLE